MIKYIFLDVAGTILSKPSLYLKIKTALSDFGYDISLDEIRLKHKLISEIIHFPDRTNNAFYLKFNEELLLSIGIVPEVELLEHIFSQCTYLPWEKFNDTSVLKEIQLPMGIISNFNSSLKNILNESFGNIFNDILVSEELGISKPNTEFYKKAVTKVGFKPDEILYIGDSFKLDIVPASNLGIKCLLIDRDNFYRNSNCRISNLNEIRKFI